MIETVRVQAPDPEMRPDPEAMIGQTVANLVSAFQDGSELRIAQATLSVGDAMIRAYDATDPATRPIDARTKLCVELDWTPYARARLEEYIEAHPDTEELIRSSLFFDKDAKVLRMIGRVVSARSPRHG